jgi:tetratricopeptide (TPR) repeat protein
MKRDLTSEQQALISLCLNNAGVDAFERGHLGKAMKFFQVALHPLAKSLQPIESPGKVSKAMIRNVIKSQSRSFAPNQTFDVVYSETFGKHSRQTRRQKLVFDKCEDSSTYVFQKVFSVKASNSVGILEQTSADQLNAVIHVNLGICHHLCQGQIEDAIRNYELAIQSSWESESKIIQVVCWNNLLHIFSNDILEEELARHCIYEIVQILGECKCSIYFSRMLWPDKHGIFFNLMISLSSGNLAPAA